MAASLSGCVLKIRDPSFGRITSGKTASSKGPVTLHLTFPEKRNLSPNRADTGTEGNEALPYSSFSTNQRPDKLSRLELLAEGEKNNNKKT